MEHELPKHEKIRFRRKEIIDLCAYPSGIDLDPSVTRQSFSRRARRACFRLFAGMLAFVLLIVAAIYAIGASGLGSERLRTEAEKALERIAGMDVDVAMGQARITFDRSSLLALEVTDVSLARNSDRATIVDAGLVRFGIRFLPLLHGDIRLSSATLADAHVMVAALPASKIDWALALRNEQGLIDPERVTTAVFAGVRSGLGVVRAGSIGDVSLENIDFVFPDFAPIKIASIVEASLSETIPGMLSLEARTDIDGRVLEITASAHRDDATGRVSALNVSAQGAARGEDAEKGPGNFNVGAVALKLTGVEGVSATPSRLSVAFSAKDTALDLGRRGIVAGDVSFGATLVQGSNKLQVDYLRAFIGRSVFDFYGVAGPRPPTGQAGDEAAYRYELISAKSILSPEGSPEAPLSAYLRLGGVYLPNQRKLSTDELVLKGGAGEALGSASIQFAPGQNPGISAAFSLQDMPVSQAKQLWPWFSATPARNWVMQNVFGGKVTDGTVQLQVPPGRLGNGVPLNAAESFGTFSVEDARFDTAGLMPPVRDAVGVVTFGGPDVDIALSSGTVYLPGGNTVAVSDGALKILKSNVPPVIGQLDINVKGDASAVIELASYDPINAMRLLQISSSDFSGQVSGNVKADIPLQKGIDRKLLGFHVEMAYQNLAIAKPMEGQMVTDANGTIVVQPDRVVIDAKARLTGVPAEIAMVMPLREGGPERERTVTLSMDDKQRDKLIPGLSDLLSGPIKVTLEAADGGKQRVRADLTQAKLDLPWVGWSKGPGIGGNVSFLMAVSNGATTLSEFELTGKTFNVNGQITLSNGGLATAIFRNAKLNRDDDVSVSVKRTGKGFAVTVNGSSLDARSIVKLFMSESSGAEAKADPGSVTVDANVKTLVGFHDERLSNVALDYSGAGGRVNNLTVNAVTSSGKSVEFRNGSEGGGRTMRMTSADAGAVLRFLDIYENMEGGTINLSLKGGADGPMTGQVDALNFFVVNEPRLSSLVSTTPPGDKMSLNQAVKKDIDTSRVKFERGFSQIEKGAGYLKLSQGVLRGPLIGMTFQGTLYDKSGNMDMTGTFMPAYGLNRIFGEIPLVGLILGNGRDRGLIGVTFKLEGDADKPNLRVNPLSVIAPGIFRSIFEFQ